MNPSDYQRLAARTECDQEAARDRMNRPPTTDYLSNSFEPLVGVRLNHSVVGLAGEVGELAALVEKWLYYGKEFSADELRARFQDEFGDLLWYVALGLNALGLDMSEVMAANLRKLAVRYPIAYSNERAADEARNRAAEAQAVSLVVADTERLMTGPDPSHDWEHNNCRRCGAYRNLGSGLLPCPEPADTDIQLNQTSL